MLDDVAADSQGTPTLLPLGSQAHPPELAAVSRARRFVQARMQQAGLCERADDAGLLVSELAANAVLHARSGFEVHVHAVGSTARVEVHDRSGVLPVCTAPSATAMSGRGLTMVTTVATRWGTEPLPDGGKSVWFEVAEEDAGPGEDVTVDELLALWADVHDEPGLPGQRGPDTGARPRDAVAAAAVEAVSAVVDAGPHAAGESAVRAPRGAIGEPRGGADASVLDVVVPDLPVRGLLAAKEHMDDLLRELQLVLLTGTDAPVPPAHGSAHELAVARRLDTAARAFEVGRRQVREQVTRAAAHGLHLVTLHLWLSAATAEASLAYRDAVEEAEQLSRSGSLLALADELGHHGELRHRYLDAVARRLGRHRAGG